MYSGYGDQRYQTDYQDSRERQRKKVRADDLRSSAPYSYGYGERHSKKARMDLDEARSTAQYSHGYQDRRERQSNKAWTGWDEPGATAQYSHGYQDRRERRSNKARTGWDEQGATAQFSHGYRDSGYTSSSTRYPRYSPETVDDLDKADYSTLDDKQYHKYSLGLQGSQSTSNLTSYQGLYSVPNIPKSEYNNSGEFQGFSSGTGVGRVFDLGRSGNKGSLGIMGGSRVDTVSQRSDQSNRFESEFTHTSGLSLRQNYGGSGYSNMMMLDDGSIQQNQSRSSHSAAYANPDFNENGISRFGIDANIGQTVKFDSVADIQEGFGYGGNYKEKESLRSGRSFQHERAEKITWAHNEPGTLETSRIRGQQRRSAENQSLDWKHQYVKQERDFADTRHYSGSFQRNDTRQGQRSVFGQGKDESDFETKLALRMAAEIQQRKQGKVNVNKILKVMEIVDQMSEDVNQGFIEEDSRGRTAKSGCDFSHDVHGMRGSSGRQGRSGSHGRGINTMKQRGGVGWRGQGSQMTKTDQRSMMRGDRMNMRDGVSRRNMERQIVDEEMTGHGIKNRNRRKSSVETSDERGKPKSQMDKDVHASERQIHNIIEFLKTTKRENENAVRDIESAVQRSSLGLKVDYQVDLPSTAGNFPIHSGRLFISGVFIARAAGRNKKLVKRECFEKALHLLKTQSAEVIMKQKDNKKDEIIKEKIEELDKIVKERAKLCENEDGNEEGCILEFRNQYIILKDLLKFVNIVDEDDVDDDVTALSDTISQSGLDYSYSDEETETARGSRWFIGNLKMGDILVGVGSGPSRRYAKRRTFTRALKFLKKCKSFMQLVEGLTETEDWLVPEFDLLYHVQALPNSGTRKRLSVMIKILLKMPEGNVIKDIEEAANSSKLVISLLYKKGCRVDLFLDEIFISSGESRKRQEAVSQAYHEALTVLCSSSADVIFSDFKRMSQEDSKDLFEMLVVTPNEKRRIMYTSNEKKVAMQRKAFCSLIADEDSEDITDQDKIIIMENKKLSGDRYNKAFDILQTSAEWNCMIFQKKVTQFQGGTCCQIFLGNMKVAEASSQSFEEASKQGPAKALFKLYQTRPTISMMRFGDLGEYPITYEFMKAKADVLKKESGDTSDDDYIYIGYDEWRKDKSRNMEEQQMEEEEEEENLNDGSTSTLPANKWLKQIIEEMIQKFASEENLEEIVFGGEFPPGDKLQIQITAKKYNVGSRRFKANDTQYLVIYQKHLPSKILEILENSDGHSGLFSIIPKEELPKPSDVESFQKPVENKSTRLRHSNQNSGGGKKSLDKQYKYEKQSLKH